MTATVETTVKFSGSIRTVRVPSATRKDVNHTILLACSCEGFQFNGYCYHLSDAAVILREEGRLQNARQRARLKR